MYYTYILKCVDSTLYTGITNNYQKRFKTHLSGTGAKYTRTHKPDSIIALWESSNRITASKLEYHIKRLTKKEKLLIVENNLSSSKYLIDKLDINAYKKISDF